MTSITRRWLFNSFAVILGVLIAFELISVVFVRGFYYDGVKQIVASRAKSMSGLLNRYPDNYPVSNEVRLLIEGFDDRDKMEMMALDYEGNVIVTSSGFKPDERMYMPDYDRALISVDKRGEYQGYTYSGENIYAITLMLPGGTKELAAVRYVVSLTDVDNQIVIFILTFTIIAMCILFFVIISSSYFIKSILIPVGEVGKIASTIAAGNFSARLKKKNDDEIGELCDIINSMAVELGKSEQMKNDFISAVSHELRTPLTAIKGWAETISLAGPADRKTLEKGMNVIIGETGRLTGMVEELLDFSRIQSGRFALHKEKMDILAELGDAVLMFTERAKKEHIEIVYEEPEMLPILYADKNRLRQVFVNIIDNAMKYSQSGGRVTIEAFERDENVVIRISDTGCGIKAEDLPYVKQKFFKANYTRRGSGIGLAVADEIVTQHGGELKLDSIEGEGTTVTIILAVSGNG